MILLARNGIAALSYDPVGQGERYLILDDEGNRVHSSVDEHTLLGVASMPVGRNAATYRVWDGLRAIDYLASREDFDAQRLGVTGCSGGGTMTSYLMALDERLKAAAPSCYISSFDWLIDTIGPQDAEQNIHGQIAFGMDHADYIHMRAPRPTLVLASTHDFFDVDGVWQTFREAKQLYTRMRDVCEIGSGRVGNMRVGRGPCGRDRIGPCPVRSWSSTAGTIRRSSSSPTRPTTTRGN